MPVCVSKSVAVPTACIASGVTQSPSVNPEWTSFGKSDSTDDLDRRERPLPGHRHRSPISTPELLRGGRTDRRLVDGDAGARPSVVDQAHVTPHRLDVEDRRRRAPSTSSTSRPRIADVAGVALALRAARRRRATAVSTWSV